MEVTWGPNWDDDLAGGHHAREDVNLAKMGDDIVFDYEEVFMRYLPRLCNHCLNPACVQHAHPVLSTSVMKMVLYLFLKMYAAVGDIAFHLAHTKNLL